MSNWQNVHLQALERDEYTCQHCGQTIRLDVHHKIPKHKGGLDILENLISLCRSYHKIEKFKDRISIEWKLVRIRKTILKKLIELKEHGDSMSDVIDMLLESYHENKGKSSLKDKVIKKLVIITNNHHHQKKTSL